MMSPPFVHLVLTPLACLSAAHNSAMSVLLSPPRWVTLLKCCSAHGRPVAHSVSSGPSALVLCCGTTGSAVPVSLVCRISPNRCFCLSWVRAQSPTTVALIAMSSVRMFGTPNPPHPGGCSASPAWTHPAGALSATANFDFHT
ncbi:hypothetical protein PF005_g9637 [Phytophthora fragariae]|uniref:Ig-like domain-containing protein n=1 Tax=Phytophthora fragariae TaxID=53985 RepID=A0A6A3ZNJ6_9STRA|nr:hypothetical protein PF003_g22135 [Phytophthora fragariae]KAE8939439.1 hypothetical protein PF009_g10714 [Phytophthora fragariae]KAE9016310.1 hypothetical protein PF011_g7208 [Phytophthora fragariae]KAE9116138.1 hypothetical protein PF007_g9770 [Phytophthora fragariae]KAE9116289.1 hypothetical protein PF010_g9019 [Phytophthora fragariae]